MEGKKIHLEERHLRLLKEYLDKNYNMPLAQYFQYWTFDASMLEKALALAERIPTSMHDYMQSIVDNETPYGDDYDEEDDIDYDAEAELFNQAMYFLQEYEGEDNDDYYSLAETFVNILDENGRVNDYVYKIEDYAHAYELPSWYYLTFIRVVKNEWCVHFCEAPYSIAREGFTGGTEDLDNLALTRWQEKEVKGYNFAYPLTERNINDNNYGTQGVIFRTSGVECQHKTDGENQVIFYGPYAKDFIPFQRHLQENWWAIVGRNGKKIYSAETPTELIQWATDNLPQYRKQMLYSKGYRMEEKGAAPENDEYEIGFENNSPLEYAHIVQEGKYELCNIGSVTCSSDFDEDEYLEWLEDNEYEDSEARRMEYFKDGYVEFEVEYTDAETDHYMDREYMTYDELEDTFGTRLSQDILDACLSGEEGRFYVSDYMDDDDVDTNDLNSIEADAVRKLQHGNYFKGARGFILTNGIMVYTESEHNMITRVSGINDKFQAIKMGWVRVLPNSIDLGKEPTQEQALVLRNIIQQYSDSSEFYVDFFSEKGEYGTKYSYPDYRMVMADIDRFFEEGIRPVRENVEYEFAPSDVDLSSFKTNDELNPKIWDGDKLNSRIRLKLLDIADDFFDTLNIRWIKPKDIILTGSICNFNWSKYSDIDLHIVVDFNEVSEKTELVKEYFDAKKNQWNNEHENLEINGFPVELYVQDSNEFAESKGVYSLEKNKWLSTPKRDDFVDIENVSDDIKDMAATLMTYIEDAEEECEDNDDKHQLEELLSDVEDFTKEVKAIRKYGLEKNSETSAGNVIYKILRREGFLDRAYELKTKLYDKINSLP